MSYGKNTFSRASALNLALLHIIFQQSLFSLATDKEEQWGLQQALQVETAEVIDIFYLTKKKKKNKPKKRINNILQI